MFSYRLYWANLVVGCGHGDLQIDFYQKLRYNLLSYAGVAQLFRARPCQGRGQGLESLYPHQLAYA